MAARKVRSGTARRTGVEVRDDERRHMIECCAFFSAARYRPAHPGGYRGQDLADAAARIDAILAKHQRPPGDRRTRREAGPRRKRR